MNELESNLKTLIIQEYGSLKKFTEIIDMPWTTLNSILNRGGCQFKYYECSKNNT